MKVDELSQHVEGGRVVAIDGDDLATLLPQVHTIRDHDTSIAGHIRILEFGGRILVQEQTPEGELFLRRLPSEEAAQRFVEERIAAYERMWDG